MQALKGFSKRANPTITIFKKIASHVIPTNIHVINLVERHPEEDQRQGANLILNGIDNSSILNSLDVGFPALGNEY